MKTHNFAFTAPLSLSLSLPLPPSIFFPPLSRASILTIDLLLSRARGSFLGK